MHIQKVILKVLIIGIPTYTIAYLTEAMVYTIPMLAITTIIATSITDLDLTDKRVNLDISKDAKDNQDG